MADLELSSSAASLINLAAYTSAFADMILLYASLRSFAAEDRESCKSRLSWISFMKIYSIWMEKNLRLHPIPLRIDRPVFRYRLLFPVSSRAYLAKWTVRKCFWE